MEAFGEEIDGNHRLAVPGPITSAWQSKVLTPILQRQLQGVSDAYTPSIDAGVGPDENDDDNNNSVEGELTIAAVTKFYLATDPVHPDCIPFYVRNLVYNREM